MARTLSSGRGKLVPIVSIIVQELLCGHTSLVWITVGFPKTHVMPSSVCSYWVHIFSLSLHFTLQGYCSSSLGIALPTPFSAYPPSQTGGGNGVINAADQASYGVWPPTAIFDLPNAATLPATFLPTYTATGPIPTLPTQTYPAVTPQATFNGGDGWLDAADTIPGVTTVAGCTYPSAWNALSVPVPTAVCTGTPVTKREPEPQAVPLPIITPM